MLDNDEYSKYVKTQTEANKKKLDRVFEYEENINMLSEYMQKKLPKIESGICHGTRRGKEQEWFSKYLSCDDVIGTEISDTATQFPKTIQWDFHNLKDEWKNHFDFIYSNSLDHSYDILYCISQWTKCLKKNGLIIINGTTAHMSLFGNKSDIGGYSKKQIQKIINNTPNLKVIDVLKGKKTKMYYLSWYYVIAQKV